MSIKILHLTLLLLPNIPVFAQTTVLWSDSMVVASTTLPVTAPKVSLLADGTPIMTWGTSSNTNSQIWCSRFEAGIFTPPVAIVPSPAQPALFGFGGYDVAVANNQVFVVFEQLSSGIWMARSDDGGLHFNAPVQVQGPVSGGGVTIASVAVDGTGNPIVSYIREKNGATYQVRRSPDSGDTWGEPVTANAAAPGGMVCECCSSDFLTSGDSTWIVFRNNNQNLRDIWVSRSTDLAANFDIATDVDDTDWQVNICPISGPHIARSGDSILTVWMSQATGISKVYCNTLHAGTMQAGQQINFPSLLGPQVVQTFPEIAAAGDTVGLVFLEKSKEIVFYHSTQGMTQLNTQPQRFSVPNHIFQFPSLAYEQGVFHLIYADPNADKVFYRRGVLTQLNAAFEPLKSDVSIFPNPVDGSIVSIFAENNSLQAVSIFDVHGKELLARNATGNTVQLNLSGMPHGVYILKVKTADGESIRKLVKN